VLVSFNPVNASCTIEFMGHCRGSPALVSRILIVPLNQSTSPHFNRKSSPFRIPVLMAT
jgi:hypothetical protein